MAYIRASESETLLILINIDDKPITDFNLDLSVGPLSGEYTLTSLLDETAFPNLPANTKGGFDNYIPMAELPPYSTYIIQLTK